jgi:hypothetical protein
MRSKKVVNCIVFRSKFRSKFQGNYLYSMKAKKCYNDFWLPSNVRSFRGCKADK